MALIIAANIDVLGAAAGEMATVATGFDPGAGLPSLGHPEADAALSDFSSAMSGHARRVADAAERGSHSLRGYVIAFHKVGA